MKGKLIIVSAPSGAGKTSIVKQLLNDDLNLEFSISACSREKRPDEIHAKDYYFLSVDDFKNKIEKQDFVEWEEVYKGHFYGTLKSEVERIRNTGKNVIFDVDVVGGLNIKKIYKEDALAIFIIPPSKEELKNRLQKRNTEDEERLNMRIDKASKELLQADKFDVKIVNEVLHTAIHHTKQAIKQFLKI